MSSRKKLYTLLVLLIVLAPLVMQCGGQAEPEVIVETVVVEKEVISNFYR